jgi:hypothetical protein
MVQTTYPGVTGIISSALNNFESSPATFVATATFDITKALLAGILFPLVISLILARMKGVFECPWKPCSAASRTA